MASRAADRKQHGADGPRTRSEAAPLLTLSDCWERFEEIRQEVEADVEGTNEVLGTALCVIIRDALGLETPETSDELVAFLTHVARSTFNPTAVGLVLNNLGCVEKRRGNHKVALHHLKRAADEEGGIVTASPTTLLNISAVYSALGMFAEAASISNHAVLRCETDIQRVSPSVYSAALYNLAAALEGSGELEHAAQAYRKSLEVLESGGVTPDHPQHRSTVKARDQLELRLRNHRGNQKREEWAKTVLPSIIRKTADRSLNQSNSPQRLNPLERSRGTRKEQGPHLLTGNSPTEDRKTLIPRSGSEHDLALGLLSTNGKRLAVSNSPVSPSANSSVSMRQKDIEARYHASVRDFHVFPINSRAHNRKYKGIELANWDMNPLPNTESVQRSLGKDPTVDRAVGMSYVPHHLVPFMADLKYKEHTRRTMIISSYMTRMAELKKECEHNLCAIEEDESRVDVEISELRARKVLQQWFKGKIVFVTHYSEVEAEERKGRHQMHKALGDHILSLQPYAKCLQLQVEEEAARGAVRKRAQIEYKELMLVEETERTRRVSVEACTSSKVGIAHALALWCLEGVVPPAAALKLADDAYLHSYYVQSRHLWFGKPHGYAKPPPKASADGSQPTSGAQNATEFEDEEYQ